MQTRSAPSKASSTNYDETDDKEWLGLLSLPQVKPSSDFHSDQYLSLNCCRDTFIRRQSFVRLWSLAGPIAIMNCLFSLFLLASSSFPLLSLAGPIEKIDRRGTVDDVHVQFVKANVNHCLRYIGISQSLLSTFDLYEQYAAAAYCPGNNNISCIPGAKITCSTGNCPLVQTANTASVIQFCNQFSTDVTGYVATDSTNNLIVVAFRGSETIANWITDLEFPLMPIGLCKGCNGETGFWTSWSQARSEVFAAVATAVAANPTFKIVSTGHSLGGAIAALAAADLRNSGYVVDMVCQFLTALSYTTPDLPSHFSSFLRSCTNSR